jgi:uncharacterized radical SAM superfamily protein
LPSISLKEEIDTVFQAENETQLEESLSKAREITQRKFGKKILFYAPRFMYYKTSYYRSSPGDFPTISVTGRECSLKCRHCEGKVLESMYPASTGEQLFAECIKLKQSGASGCLISGGCLPDGTVPLAKFIDSIKRVKRELHLTVFVHTGITDLETARQLRKAGVDAALIDILGSDDTIKEICNLNAKVKNYENSLKALNRSRMAFVPHIIVGLHYGKLIGELNALEMVSRHKPSALVVIAFIPIRGTKMEDVEPPTPLDIAKILTAARLMFPSTPLALGCMRPKGRHRTMTDILAIKAGVNAIAFPSEEGVGFAKHQRYQIEFSPFCCARVYSDVVSKISGMALKKEEI